MARRGDLPRYLEQIHPRHGVPGRAVLLIGAIVAVVAATGSLRGVASAASFTILVYYGIANLAAFRMPRAARLYHDAVPVIGLGSCAILALSLTPSVIMIGLFVLAAGFAFRMVLRKMNGERIRGGSDPL
jgi:APA family basic amino acid/polyamine antiporter